MKKKPEHYKKYPKPVMSNFDHLIDTEVANAVKQGKLFAQYAAWNFCGYVWWDKAWACEVWRDNRHIETVEAETLEEIMEMVSEKYGDR